MNCCISCRWFKDAEYSRTYVCPRCTVRGDDDDCAYMRQNVCGLSGTLYEPIRMEIAPKEIGHRPALMSDAAQGQTIMSDAQRQSPAVSD